MKASFSKIAGLLGLVFLLGWYGFFLCSKVDLTTTDLGRHLKNGELFFDAESRGPLLKTNFYSYTEPDFPIINHHWGGGVLFFLFHKMSGFAGVHLFFIVLALATFLIFFRLAQKEAGTVIAFLLGLLLIPLIAQRREIRPEFFSYFFAGLFFWLLWQYHRGQLKYQYLFLLPVIEVIWINSHILFFLGPVLVGTFLLDKIILFFKAKKESIKKLLIVFCLTCFATLLNPFGLKAVLYPFNIFKNYGYRLLENQTVWFLEKLGFIVEPNFLLFKIVLGSVWLSFFVLLLCNKKAISLPLLFLAIVGSALGLFAIRNFTVFGLFALPIIAFNIKNIIGQKIKLKTAEEMAGFAFLGLVIFVICLAAFSLKLPLGEGEFGSGLLPGNDESAEFFKEHHLQGPIFNNYDIGNYLVYELYPKEPVFVENRPEAYPVSFFQDVYIPMQENEDVWQEQAKAYNFNAIFFSHRDATPWGQEFLKRRVEDREWAVVFADDFAIIFLKRNDLNGPIIEKYEIPKERFGTI